MKRVRANDTHEPIQSLTSILLHDQGEEEDKYATEDGE